VDEQLLADGRDVTFIAVAQVSGIARATCYRNRDLRSIIDTYRSRHGEQLTLTALADRSTTSPRPSTPSPRRCGGKIGAWTSMVTA